MCYVILHSVARGITVNILEVTGSIMVDLILAVWTMMGLSTVNAHDKKPASLNALHGFSITSDSEL